MNDQRRILPESYQAVYRKDFGKGYLTLDILVGAAYVINTIALIILFRAMVATTIENAVFLVGPLLTYGVIYVTRLLIRATLAWRDRNARSI